MIFSQVRYKTYEWSNRATYFSHMGGFLKGIVWILVSMIIFLLVSIPTAANPNFLNDLKIVIPILLLLGVTFFIAGNRLQKKAEKISVADFEAKVINDFEFAKKMAKNNPEDKQWYMRMNPQYAEYVESGNEALDVKNEPTDEVKKIGPVRRLIGILMAIGFAGGTLYILGVFN